MTQGYQVASTSDFFKSQEKLSKSQRSALADTIEKVQLGMASAHVHQLESLPFVSFGVNKDALRVICKREGDLLLMCHVGAHDPAYDWARRHKVLQIGRVVRILRCEVVNGDSGEDSKEDGVEPNEDWAKYLPPGPLKHITDKVFFTFGVERLAAGVLRQVPHEDALADLLQHFPAARGEALLELALDPTDLDGIETRYLEALDKQARGEELRAPTFREAVSDEINVGSIWNPKDKDAYRRALEGGFDAWRVFLHPSQHRVVFTKTKGALKVTGGPGTGKTVVALHRAKALAERHEGTLLLTTYTGTLAKQLAKGMKTLLGEGDELLQRVQTRSLTAVAQNLLRSVGAPAELVTDTRACWERAMEQRSEAESERVMRFYELERELVLARHNAWTWPAYMRAPRTGRGTRIDRKARRDVWTVLEAFERELTWQGGGDVIALCRDATHALRSGGATSPYRSVLCDEVQDMGAAELRLLAALACEPAALAAAESTDDLIAAMRPDGLTLCGDGHQRLYSVPVTLRDCGIRVGGGSSRKLRLNYRTTDAIRRAAVALVQGIEVDELDADSGSPLSGYRSLRQGVPPDEQTFVGETEEAEWIAERAREDRGQMLVLVRTRKYRDALREKLEARGVQPRVLSAKDSVEASDTLLLTTLHRAKGLEAPRVIVAGRHLVPLRYRGGGDARDRALWERKERSLLYVGMTRARDWCAVTMKGEQ